MARQTAKTNKAKAKTKKARARTAGPAKRATKAKRIIKAKRATKTVAKRKASVTKRKPTVAKRKVTVRKSITRSAPTDAIALLKHDHRQVLPLLRELKDAPPSRRERLLEQVEHALQTHTKIEEEIFYPAFRDVAANDEDRQMYEEALEEHHAVDVILREVSAAKNESEAFAGRAKVLKEMVEHHAEEEENEMFPRARQLFPASELKRLGDEMQARKRTLSQGSGPLAMVAALFSR